MLLDRRASFRRFIIIDAGDRPCKKSLMMNAFFPSITLTCMHLFLFVVMNWFRLPRKIQRNGISHLTLSCQTCLQNKRSLNSLSVLILHTRWVVCGEAYVNFLPATSLHKIEFYSLLYFQLQYSTVFSAMYSLQYSKTNDLIPSPSMKSKLLPKMTLFVQTMHNAPSMHAQ
jgi:hypothetical protein